MSLPGELVAAGRKERCHRQETPRAVGPRAALWPRFSEEIPSGAALRPCCEGSPSLRGFVVGGWEGALCEERCF